MVPDIGESPVVNGVLLVNLRSHSDDRGRFTEIFRKEWFPGIDWTIIQSNRSDSQAGVLRGLHYHHKQVDYWYVVKGSIRAGLVDLRKSSSSYLNSQTVDLDAESAVGLLIPEGVAHGFLAQTEATLMYIVNQYYDGDDEFGVLWNDSELGISWGTTNPILSARDQANPGLSEIASQVRPI